MKIASPWKLGALACAVAMAAAAAPQQVPTPQTAAEVPGPALGPMTEDYVQTVGRIAYLWGWPLVYVYNQRTQLTKVPEVGLLAGAMPIAPMNQIGMLTGYISPGETFIADPNQDVVYGLGYLSLEKEPEVLQVPDFGDRASGPSQCTTPGPIRSANLGCSTAPSPVSTWWWGLTGRAISLPASPAWRARPPTSPLPCRAYSSATRPRIKRPSNPSSVRLSCTH